MKRLGAVAVLVAVLCLAWGETVAAALWDLVWKADSEMHGHFTDRFLGAVGFGYSRMVAPPMVVTDFMWLNIDGEGYKLGTLELIGIAKHESPVAFVDILHNFPESRRQTRELSAFEQTAIRKLAAGENVVVETAGNRRRVVGALRAGETCLRCHPGYGQGDMLGALSYRLDRARVPTE